jgi:hypothetical protein
MFEKKYERKKENFTCSKCNTFVEGTGYTDHCPNCLWSKHVDVNPGDRKAECKGMMEPIGVKPKGFNYIIYYKCNGCGHSHRVKSTSDDNFEEILKLSSRPIKE